MDRRKNCQQSRFQKSRNCNDGRRLYELALPLVHPNAFHRSGHVHYYLRSLLLWSSTSFERSNWLFDTVRSARSSFQHIFLSIFRGGIYLATDDGLPSRRIWSSNGILSSNRICGRCFATLPETAERTRAKVKNKSPQHIQDGKQQPYSAREGAHVPTPCMTYMIVNYLQKQGHRSMRIDCCARESVLT